MSQNTDKNLEDTLLLGEIIQWGASEFEANDLYYGHGTDNAYDEALNLCFSVIDLPFEAESLEKNISAEEKKKILRLFKRRIEERVPAAYLTQQAYFAGIPFYVDERVLVPRSPIAELIDNEFSPWLQIEKIHRVLDMCTGSACIAIAIAKYFPKLNVDAIDISKDALAVADINVKKHRIADRVNLIESDLFSALSSSNKYDLIISNPPYVDKQDLEAMPTEYHREPQIGLEAGEDGLLLVDKILKDAHRFLNDEGILIVEVGNSAEALEKKYPEVSFMWLSFENGGEGVFLLRKEQLKVFV